MTQAFVYRWNQKSTGMYYIGSRTAKNCHPGDGYICSSKVVKPLILANPDDWERHIIETPDAYATEKALLKYLDAKNDPRSYNQCNGTPTNTGHSLETRRKIALANKGKKISEEQKRKQSITMSGPNNPNRGRKRPKHAALMREKMLGELNPMYGKTHTDETRAKLSRAHKGTKKPWSAHPGNKFGAGNRGKIQDETWKRKRLDKIKGPHPKTTCPHCGLTGGARTMTRWHFNNCKHK